MTLLALLRERLVDAMYVVLTGKNRAEHRALATFESFVGPAIDADIKAQRAALERERQRRSN